MATNKYRDIFVDYVTNNGTAWVKITGVWKVPNAGQCVPNWLRTLTVVYLGYFLYTISLAIFIFSNKNNMTTVIGGLIFFTLNASLIVEIQIYMTTWHKFNEILQRLRTDQLRIANEHQRAIASSTMKYAEWYWIFGKYSVYFTAIAMIVGPFAGIVATGELVLPLPMWLPFDPYRSYVTFGFVYVYQSFCIITIGFCRMGCNGNLGTLLQIATTQLRLLKDMFENLTIQRDSQHVTAVKANDVIEMNVKMAVERHVNILGYCNRVRELYDFYLAFQFGIVSILLCVTLFQLSTATTLADVVALSLYISCVVSELLWYCLFGSGLSTESANLCTSVYKCNWISGDAKFRKDLRIIMLMSQRTIEIKVAKIIPFTLPTFLAIINKAFSFYTLLKSVS